MGRPHRLLASTTSGTAGHLETQPPSPGDDANGSGRGGGSSVTSGEEQWKQNWETGRRHSPSGQMTAT